MPRALEKSISVAMVLFAGLRSLKPVTMLVTKGTRAVEVERSGGKPCWKSDRVKVSEKRGRRWRSSCMITGLSREMNRYDVLSSDGWSGFWMGIKTDFFQTTGMSEWSREKIQEGGYIGDVRSTEIFVGKDC